LGEEGPLESLEKDGKHCLDCCCSLVPDVGLGAGRKEQRILEKEMGRPQPENGPKCRRRIILLFFSVNV
jgi:hypothetical protein